MNPPNRISAAALTEFTVEVLQSQNAPEDRARLTAEVLVGADLRGIYSHGVAGGTGLMELFQRIRAGGIRTDVLPEVQRKEGLAVAAMDVKGGLGQAAAMEAAHLAGDLAEKHGIGKVYIRNGNHFGAAGIYAEALVARGLAARVTCTAGAWVVPFGGNRKRLGTNPIAWGVPCGDEALVIDIATTQRAISPALRACRAGEPIPPDYFTDASGAPLEGVVPLETLLAGSARPLGGENFGYKGSGLAILIEMDGAMGGGPAEEVVNQRVDPQSRVAQTFEAWRLDFLLPAEEARARIAHAAADIRRAGGPEMLLPGEREARRKADAERNGIPYDPGQWETLRQIAEMAGVKVPD